MVGSYLHGVFASDPVRAAFLEPIAGMGIGGAISYEDAVEATLDKLAAHLERHLDVEAILALARQRPPSG